MLMCMWIEISYFRQHLTHISAEEDVCRVHLLLRPLPPAPSAEGWRRLTELEGLRLSWDNVSGGNWNSAGRVVFLLLALRADLLLVVAACGETADNVRFTSDTLKRALGFLHHFKLLLWLYWDSLVKMYSQNLTRCHFLAAYCICGFWLLELKLYCVCQSPGLCHAGCSYTFTVQIGGVWISWQDNIFFHMSHL